jgi:hypothetical protein
MDILAILRSDKQPSIQKFSIYVPDKDKYRQPIEPSHDAWVEAALHVLTDINGGCTLQPSSRGVWKTQDGEFLEDDVAIVYSFITDDEAFKARFHEISAFMHRFGIEAKQESVLVELTDGHRAYFLDETSYQDG